MRQPDQDYEQVCEYVTWLDSRNKPRPMVQRQINQPKIFYYYDEWTRAKIPEACKTMKEWKCERMIMEDNNRPSMIKDMSVVPFPCLKILTLSKNNIFSVQSFSHFQAPVLEDIHLDCNNINTFNAFKKLNSRKLLSLDFYNNCLNDGMVFTFVTSRVFELLRIEKTSYDCDQCYNLAFLVKLPNQGEDIFVDVKSDRRLRLYGAQRSAIKRRYYTCGTFY